MDDCQIHPSDIVRFELDMDAGNCRAFVNGADQVGGRRMCGG